MKFTAPRWLRHLTPPRMRDRVRRRKLTIASSEGPPPNLDEVVLEEVFLSHFESRPLSYSHTNVSGYKESNAFLIRAEMPSGVEASLVWKNMDLRPESYPAIEGFPGPVGVAGLQAQTSPTADLRSFVPEIIRCVELIEQRHYQLFAADLNRSHRMTYTPRDLLRCVRRLVELGPSLAEWAATNSVVTLIRYDDDFPRHFLEYSWLGLSRYLQRTGDPSVQELLRHWEQVTDTYLRETPDEAHDHVHGDYRVGNIFHQRANPDRIRLVDWEFAGVGWIHNDLASLLKLADREVTLAAIGIVAEAQPHWTLDQHQRMYQRCRLERGLLDATLVARQRMTFVAQPRISPDHSRRVLSAVAALNR